jgi:serine phosphatase RsbU (regulator of sigma subunit)
VVSALLLERRVFGRRLDVLFWVVLVLGVATLVWIWTRPALADVYPMVALLVLGLADMLRLAVGALLRREPDAWVVAVGFAALTLSFFGSFLRNLGVWDVSPWPLFIGGMGSVVLAFSIYLTRRVVRTDRDLARRLQEVQELTARTLEQEREAREREIARRVLEADNLRKTAELEEARQLQMAMLPRSLPVLSGFGLAVHMATASEVGGDYYDFVCDENGVWTVVLGDATGHGLHAGMVVGVAKSLLQAANGVGDLALMLQRVHSGLASLQERRASMSLLLVRLHGCELQVASAGMPPMLIRRHGSGDVEEVLLPGVPLGTLAEAEWGVREVTLAAGDSVLLMSDGLAERVDPQGEPFGYERVRRAFAEAGALDPTAAVRHLVQAGESFSAGEAIADDVTLMILRADGAAA